MAKRVAYPCLITTIFLIFGINTAKSAEILPQNPEKDSAIFSQYNGNTEGLQDNSASDFEWLTSSQDGSQPSEFYGSLPEEDWAPGSQGEESSPGGSLDEQFSLSQSDVKSGGHDFVPVPPQVLLTQQQRYDAYSKHLSAWMDNIKSQSPQTPEEHRSVFLSSFPDGMTASDIYHVFQNKTTQNTHFYAPGASPVKGAGTPRRTQNISRLEKGKSPVWVDPRDGQSYQVHMHHVGQKNGETYLVMVPLDVHYSSGMHTKRGHSEIDRAEFAKERRHGRKAFAEGVKRTRLEADKENQ